jgi:glycosyltransferase involved in cell wall biosynthesis
MKMINERQVGRAFSTNQIAPMRDFVLELCDNDELHAQMSINARALAESKFSVHSAVGQILSHLARS